MKFILFKEKIASIEEDITTANTTYDRHFYLDAFENDKSFDMLVSKERDLIKTIFVPQLDIEATFKVAGISKNHLDYEFLDEVEDGVLVKNITTSENIKVPFEFVRVLPSERKLFATKLIMPQRGEFKSGFEDAWVDFVLKYKIRGTKEKIIHLFIATDEMLKDFNELLSDINKIIPERVERGFFYNLYLEKIDNFNKEK